MTAQPASSPIDLAPLWTMPPRWRPAALLKSRPRTALLGLLVLAVVFGSIVEIKGALIHSRHTDVGTYLSAAWAIRIGSDPYNVTDHNGWHYTYPPLLAIVLGPLADASAGMKRVGVIPYAVSVGLWYVLSIGFLLYGCDRLSRSLVKALGRQHADRAQPFDNGASRWAWRWWALLFWPIALCVPVICRSVVRGQVGPLWLMLVCLMICDVIERRPGRAGVWLAGAICLKVIPAFLVLYPLWRRDGRMLLGCLAGLLVGLVVIPLGALGPARFVSVNQHYFDSYIKPPLTGRRLDKAFEHEMVDPEQSDTNSFVAVLMNTGHLLFHTERSYTPPRFAKLGHWIIGGTMTALTLLAAGFTQRAGDDPINEALFIGLLAVVMLPLSPVCHPHYYLLMIPLLMAVLATYLGPAGLPRVTGGWVFLLAQVPLAHFITTIPGFEVLRDTGLVTWVAVAVWAAAMSRLWQRTHAPSPSRPFAFLPVMST